MAEEEKKKKREQEPEEEEKDAKEEILGLWRSMNEKLDKLLEKMAGNPEKEEGVKEVPAPPPAEPKKEEKEEPPEPKRRGFLDWLW